LARTGTLVLDEAGSWKIYHFQIIELAGACDRVGKRRGRGEAA
jgi:hypothetical protein